ncbi:MAG: helix-hairpin-helix domain-containing protein, partial [Bacteroidia bacterium]|nr:helix-hairpin-helix domain-containing protein [Bacteroidia bacterium]
MPQKSTIKLPLTPAEKTRLRQRKIRIGDLLEFAVDEIAGILEVPMTRARELRALAEFQEIPSVGIKFAEDLVFLGYYSVRELAEKDGATLIEEFEL